MIGEAISLARQSLSLDRRVLGAAKFVKNAAHLVPTKEVRAAGDPSTWRCWRTTCGRTPHDHRWIQCVRDTASRDRRLLRPARETDVLSRVAPVIVDVGANVGQFCNAAKLFFPDAKVFAFEPDPRVYAQLRKNTSAMVGVECFNVGVGVSTERHPLHRHRYSVMSSFVNGGGAYRMAPAARIVQFGRPLGSRGRPVCQDALIALNAEDVQAGGRE
jgi:hypothetical protein